MTHLRFFVLLLLTALLTAACAAAQPTAAPTPAETPVPTATPRPAPTATPLPPTPALPADLRLEGMRLLGPGGEPFYALEGGGWRPLPPQGLALPPGWAYAPCPDCPVQIVDADGAPRYRWDAAAGAWAVAVPEEVKAFVEGVQGLVSPWGEVVAESTGGTLLVPVDSMAAQEAGVAPAEVKGKEEWRMEGGALWYGESKVGEFGRNEAGEVVLRFEDGTGERHEVPMERVGWDVLKVSKPTEEGLHVASQEAVAVLTVKFGEAELGEMVEWVYVEGEWLRVPRSPLWEKLAGQEKVALTDLIAWTQEWASSPESWPEVDKRVVDYYLRQGQAAAEKLFAAMGLEGEEFPQIMIFESGWVNLGRSGLIAYRGHIMNGEERPVAVGMAWVRDGEKRLAVVRVPVQVWVRNEEGEMVERRLVLPLVVDPEAMGETAKIEGMAVKHPFVGFEEWLEQWRQDRMREIAVGIDAGAFVDSEEANGMIERWRLQELARIAEENNGRWGGCFKEKRGGQVKFICPETFEERNWRGGVYGVLIAMLVSKGNFYDGYRVPVEGFEGLNETLIPTVAAWQPVQ